MFGLSFQCFVGGMIVYAAIGNMLGFLHPGQGGYLIDPLFARAVVVWGVFALVAAVGIYRNWWWAYFLELALLWAVVATALFVPLPATPTNSHPSWEIPGANILILIVELGGVVFFSIMLLSRGIGGFRKRGAIQT